MSVYKDLLLNYNVKSIKKTKKPTILHEKINVIRNVYETVALSSDFNILHKYVLILIAT